VCAVREATAQVAAGKFVSEVFARHDAPTYLISDRGSPFVRELFEHVDLVTQPSCEGVDEPRVPYPDSLPSVNYRLTWPDTGEDAGVFHVM